MLEETGLPYEPHLVQFDVNDQKSAEFLSLNPYGKLPAIIDPAGPGGKPLPLFESGAILLYLADKSEQFLARDSAARYETLQWLMFQMARNRANVWPGRFLPQVCRQGISRTSDLATATLPSRNGCSRCSTRGSPRRKLDHGRHLYDRRHRHVSMGA